MVSTDVNPLGALHDPRALQDVVVGLPLHLVLQGSHLTLCLCIRQIPCGKGNMRANGGQTYGYIYIFFFFMIWIWVWEYDMSFSMWYEPDIYWTDVWTTYYTRLTNTLTSTSSVRSEIPVASTRAGWITSMVLEQNFSKSGIRLGSWNRLMWMSDTLNQI